MTYYNPFDMTVKQREAFLDWVRSEGLDPSMIDARRLAVHEGRISGFKFVKSAEGEKVCFGRDGVPVRVSFNVEQKNEIPDLDALFD